MVNKRLNDLTRNVKAIMHDSQESISFTCPTHATANEREEHSRSIPEPDFSFCHAVPTTLLPPTPIMPPIMPQLQAASEVEDLSRTITFQYEGRKMRYLILLRNLVTSIKSRIASMLNESTTEDDAIPHSLLETQLPTWIPKIASSALQLYMYAKEAYVYSQIEVEEVDLNVEELQLGRGCLGVFSVDLDAIVEACSEVICERLMVIGAEEKEREGESGDEWACAVEEEKPEEVEEVEEVEKSSRGRKKRNREEFLGGGEIGGRAHGEKNNRFCMMRSKTDMPSPSPSLSRPFLPPPSASMSPSCAFLVDTVEDEVDWDAVVAEAYSWDCDYPSRAQLRAQEINSHESSHR